MASTTVYVRVAADLLAARSDHTVTLLCTPLKTGWVGRVHLALSEMRLNTWQPDPEPEPQPEMGTGTRSGTSSGSGSTQFRFRNQTR